MDIPCIFFSMRILPHHQNTGGFFIAVLEKVKDLPSKEEKKEKKVAEDNTGDDNSSDKMEVDEENREGQTENKEKTENGDAASAVYVFCSLNLYLIVYSTSKVCNVLILFSTCLCLWWFKWYFIHYCTWIRSHLSALF